MYIYSMDCYFYDAPSLQNDIYIWSRLTVQQFGRRYFYEIL